MVDGEVAVAMRALDERGDAVAAASVLLISAGRTGPGALPAAAAEATSPA